MVNFNGKLLSETTFISIHNRGYKYGDALFETLKVVDNNILFWEDHYFRLMASMRILRMEIPMSFTMEFLEEEILKTVEANALSGENTRVRFNVDRGEGGTYMPMQDSINYSIVVESLEHSAYSFNDTENYRVDLFKDHYVNAGMLSNLKSNSKVINVLANIYAKENELDNCILLNNNKGVVEATQGNLFFVQGNTIKTPTLSDGALKGIMRKQIMELIKEYEDYSIEEVSISPFEIQKSDEVFITNVITGIQSVTHYRKKEFKCTVAKQLLEKLNEKLGLTS
ncbi:aminotransferase class IV [Winogradskyella sp. 3972H.M.0a.05]|uniref:aminotransferase class IV n=1 Tax=Winogradskyella sp. 3972H.M.0a.05 TaxID=2950277 RepID=UPI00339B10FB